MISIPEGLLNYGNTGLSAMADLMDHILNGCAQRFILPMVFVETLDTLREETNLALEDNLAALEEKESKWLPKAPVSERGEDHAHH